MIMIMMTQECFADLEESEQLMMAEQEASEGALTMTVVRAPVLRDSSSYVHDFAAGDRRHLLTLSENFLPIYLFSRLLLFTVQERRGRSPATTSSRPATARTSPPCSLTGSRSQYIHYLLDILSTTTSLQVAAGFLDVAESRQWDGKIVTVARK